MHKKTLLISLNLFFKIFTAETNKKTISPLNIALNAIQNRTNTPPHEVYLANCVNQQIAGGPLLHHAIFQGKINWVENLLSQKADVNKLSTAPRLSPLEIAASVALLTPFSSKLNQTDFDRFQIIKLLIENGADPRRPDISELLPISIARNSKANQDLQQIRALTIARQKALDKCDEFLAYIKSAKLNSAQIRALPLYQIYADHNPPLKAYLDKLDQQEKKTTRPKRARVQLPEIKPLKAQCRRNLMKKEQ
jgi:ankyrin repeat protein